MGKNDSLSLHANVICLLLALIGSTAIVRHPDWFGRVPSEATTVVSHPN
jgi:hypothetical protein